MEERAAELDHVTAAALPLAAGAALTLIDAVDPQPGQVVLVNGVSSGVGRFAVQLLAQRGITVVAAASPDSVERVRELGATDVVDYTSEPSLALDVDAVLPTAVSGGPTRDLTDR